MTADHDVTTLLRSIADVARAIYAAEASSVALLDEQADELVFQAVSGQGEEFLLGTRFPAHRGIAGFVLVSGEPMIVDDLTQDPSFARDLALSTNFVPSSLMAAPLVCGDRVLGVLEVLDPAPSTRANISDLDLLMLFATQAANAVRVLVDSRRAAAMQSLPRALPSFHGMTDETRAAGLQLIDALREMVASPW